VYASPKLVIGHNVAQRTLTEAEPKFIARSDARLVEVPVVDVQSFRVIIVATDNRSTIIGCLFRDSVRKFATGRSRAVQNVNQGVARFLAGYSIVCQRCRLDGPRKRTHPAHTIACTLAFERIDSRMMGPTLWAVSSGQQHAKVPQGSNPLSNIPTTITFLLTAATAFTRSLLDHISNVH
jgi:hypothetical protein